MNFAPPWIIRESLMTEQDTNQIDVYITASDTQVFKNANFDRSHVVYEVKTNQDGTKMLKTRFCLHENEDFEKDDIRKDSSNAALSLIRLTLLLAVYLNLSLVTADI